jgi:hypothetical protein
VGAPVLDDAQRSVVEHPGGPLLVLAGPGTGKTTTLVEAVVHRVEQRGLAPEQVLVLTFSRKAAAELRERVTARLGRTTRGALAMTFHSYAYALLRRELSAAGGPPLRLLSGPEQDLEVARLLEGERLDGAGRWPEALRPALPLRGFRQELRDLLQRAQERGVDGTDLARLGEAAGRPEWTAAGGFLDAYEGRFALDPSAEVLDHSGLVRAAAALLEDDDELRRREREARAVVLVDEYQDTDPAQVRLLQALAGDGRDLLAVGDPDQSIYAFRGADVRGVLEFPDAFRTAAGERAPVVELRTGRRSGPALLAASRAVAARLPAGRLGPRFRDLQPDPAVVRSAGRVEVLLAPSPTAEAAVVADVLRRAHLHEGLAWSQMAVLLRSTPRSLAVLRRGLHAAGVPLGVPADEVPLVEEPVVRALLDLLGRRSTLTRCAPTTSSPCWAARSCAPMRSPCAGCAVGCASSTSWPVAARRPTTCWWRRSATRVRRWPCPSGHAGRSTSRTGSRGRCSGRRRRAAPPRTCSGPRGRPAGSSAGWSPRAWRRVARGRGRPRARRRARPVRRRRPLRRPAAGRRRARLRRRRRQPGGAGRHPGPAHARGRRGPRHDGARQQGARVAAGRGRRRAGGRLARPAAARLAARCRRPRRARPAARGHRHGARPAGRAARRGAPAVLRRRHPRARAARRHGRRGR